MVRTPSCSQAPDLYPVPRTSQSKHTIQQTTFSSSLHPAPTPLINLCALLPLSVYFAVVMPLVELLSALFRALCLAFALFEVCVLLTRKVFEWISAPLPLGKDDLQLIICSADRVKLLLHSLN
eukprot:m.360073 g.360073  ORF g.360073 m.360073 type:complete len:123 (-) comp18865_c0_seq1:954-1322(-)